MTQRDPGLAPDHSGGRFSRRCALLVLAHAQPYKPANQHRERDLQGEPTSQNGPSQNHASGMIGDGEAFHSRNWAFALVQFGYAFRQLVHNLVR
jgi:hypothetical protein